jgi:hypothetical protein
MHVGCCCFVMAWCQPSVVVPPPRCYWCNLPSASSRVSSFVSVHHMPCCALLQAMRRNPFAPVVPCHRVVASDLSLGGFSGSWVRRWCVRQLHSCAALVAVVDSACHACTWYEQLVLECLLQSPSGPLVSGRVKSTVVWHDFSKLLPAPRFSSTMVILYDTSSAPSCHCLQRASGSQGCACLLQGPECSTVKRKKSMLEEEGVHITGNRVSALLEPQVHDWCTCLPMLIWTAAPHPFLPACRWIRAAV